jgi:hypothetical protein
MKTYNLSGVVRDRDGVARSVTFMVVAHGATLAVMNGEAQLRGLGLTVVGALSWSLLAPDPTVPISAIVAA